MSTQIPGSFAIVVLCACAAAVASADVYIHTVTVTNPGNTGELSGAGAGGYGPDRICGAVNYVYSIGKFEITAGQYTEFLNAVAASDDYGLYNDWMWFGDFGCGIQRSGTTGSYTYSVSLDWIHRPVNFVSWGDAARFCNWLHNGQPTGPQDLSTTEDGSYFLNGATGDTGLLAVTREPDATWVIPSEDEWYKAAYHKNDGATANYFDYATSSDTLPSNYLINPDPGNNATFWAGGYTIGSPYWRTVVGEHENSESPYGTFDQCGNVFEWNEALIDTCCRGLRGGSFAYYADPNLHAPYRDYDVPTTEVLDRGFRVILLPRLGDLDGDGDVNAADFALLENCFAGPDVAPAGPCGRSDLDADGDCDLRDLAAFQLRTFVPLGACCYPGDACVVEAEQDCTGTWLGVGTTCYPNACAAPPGMVPVPVGEFEMGDSFGEGGSNELPVHNVHLHTYYIDIYEITNGQYADALNWAWNQGNFIHVVNNVVYQQGATAYPYCDTNYANEQSDMVWDGSTFAVPPGREAHPMVLVSWYGAVAYCNWRSTMEGRIPCYDLTTWTCNFNADGFRLPTEAEWEKAAGWDPVLQRHFRFGEHTDGCGYDCLDAQRANYAYSGDPFENGDSPWTTPVGYYDGTDHAGTFQTQNAKSYYGCYDMSGNVWEWCHDWYDLNYYAISPYIDPIGPATGTLRVLRGGYWNYTPLRSRSAQRGADAPGSRQHAYYGFRCVTRNP